MTTTYANVSLNISWYDSAHTLISTSTNVKSIGSATWTYFTNAFVAPATAAYATLVPTLGGTPSAGNPLYLSYTKMVATDPTYVSSVAEMAYNSGQRSPTGVTQLN
jgi:hypothetical protein